jgi:two-component system, chemotaxis family, protein-glutamate methylesterase/glutaminase
VAEHPASHDIIVVGASAGGVEALRQLVSGLPANLRASIFVVLHIPPNAPSSLGLILDRAGPLRAEPATDFTAIEPGRIYVATPNQHLLVQRGHVRVEVGPRVNNARPSVDVLFRSAARAYGPRVVGVVLSGTLNDGALGLAAIKLRNGVTIVQDPDEAMFAGMPKSALSATSVDYCLRVADIPDRLVQLTNHVLERETMDHNARDVLAPDITQHAADEPDAADSPKHHNGASGFTCPECHGSLWELSNGESLRFECRVGHVYGVEAMLAHQGEAVEAALWSAINSLQERAATFRRLVGAHAGRASENYLDRAQQTEAQAATLHGLLRRLVADGHIG